MVLKKRRYARKARKTVKRKARRTMVRRVPRSVGIPNSMFAKIRYTSVRQASVAAGADDIRAWRINSIYDPDYSGVGHQPYYHDQYSAMYQKYIVYGVKFVMRVTATATNTNLYMPAMCVVPYAGFTPSWADMETYKEASRSQTKVVVVGQQPVVFRAYYKISSVFGVPKLTIRSEDGYSADVYSDPTKVAYLLLRFQNQDGSATVTYSADIAFTYYVKYFERQNPVKS